MKKSPRLLPKIANNYNRIYCFILLFTIFFNSNSFAQNPVLDVGVRLQKSIGLYYENGITVQYGNDRLLSNRLYLGFSYITSRFGSALGSNALKQDNYIISSTYYFRPNRMLQPFARLNTGYFHADYEAAVFDDLPNSSVLLSTEAGLGYKTNSPLKIGASFGYNLFSGNGVDGPGTLYPFYIQTSITWNILNPKSDEK